MNKFIQITLFFFCTNIAFALNTYDEQRFAALTNEIRCVVCQNQNIADSRAPLANDLRAKVFQMVNTGKTDDEIKDYLVKRYGEFILLRPRFNALTVGLWLFPFAGLAIIFLLIYRLLVLQANPS